MYIDNNSFPFFSEWDISLYKAIASWNDVSNFKFKVYRTNIVGGNLYGNGINEIAIVSESQMREHPDAPAVTAAWIENGYYPLPDRRPLLAPDCRSQTATVFN